MIEVIRDVRFVQDDTLCFGDLHIEDGFIERIDYKTPKPQADIAICGFVDTHTHGFRGYRCESKKPNELRQLAMEYAKRGIVGFVATLDPLPFAEIDEILNAYRVAFKGEYKGARFLGVHLEGPYLNPVKANDMDISLLKPIDLKELEAFLWKNSDLVRIVSIAPELENGKEAVAMLHRFGIQISFAHSIITYGEAMEAIKAGVSRVTHICNAMNEVNHHEPGLIDAIFNSQIMCEVNMDQSHIQKEMLAWLIRLLGSQRVMAISDGSPHSGFEYPDNYEVEKDMVIHNRAIYYKEALTGSTKDLLDAFQYLYNDLQLPIYDCMAMTSINASRSLQALNFEIGLGKRVDVIVLDHNAELKDVIIKGKRAI